MKKNKMNRYGKALGMAVVGGQVFREKYPKAKEICQDCGKVFVGGPRAFLCPECRKERVRAAHKTREHVADD